MAQQTLNWRLTLRRTAHACIAMLAVVVILLPAVQIHASGEFAQFDNQIVPVLPHAEQVGQGRLEVFVWNLYDLYLYAPYGKWQLWDSYALRFEYLRAFSAEELVDSAVDQMRRHQNVDELQLAAWHNRLRDFVPDVERGFSLVIVFIENKETIFYFRSLRGNTYVEAGRVTDSHFTRSYSNIWLGKNVEYPELRDSLLEKI